ERPRLALERRPDEDEDGPSLEGPPSLPVENGLGQEQRERGPARGPRARASGRRRGLAGRRLLAAGVGRTRDARRLAFLSRVDGEVHAAALGRHDGLLLHLDGAMEADDVASLSLELAAKAGVKRQREDERAGGAGLDRGREHLRTGLCDDGRVRGHPWLRHEVGGGLGPGFLDGPAVRLPDHSELGRHWRRGGGLRECARPRGRVARRLEARRELVRERRDGGPPLLERSVDAARSELARDDEEARVNEERREDGRREEEEVRHGEAAPHPPQKAAQEVPRRAEGEDGTPEDEDDDAQRAHAVDRNGREKRAREEDEARDFEGPGRLHGAGGRPAARAASRFADSLATYVICDGNARCVPAFSTTSSSMMRSSSCAARNVV